MVIGSGPAGRTIFGPPGAASSGQPVSTLGVMLPVFGTIDGNIRPSSIAEAAVYGEQHDLDGLWLGDHLVHPLPLLESIVTLEHVASMTTRVRIGTSVMLLALRNPLAAAKQLATIAAYHPERLTLGVGVGGEHPAEFRASGVPLDQRAARLEQSVLLLRELWSGEPVTADGPLQGVRIAPIPPRIPLLFGGHTPPALRRAARLGDAWVGFYKDVDGFRAARDTIVLERKRLGLEGVDFPVGMVLPTLITERDTGADARAAEFMRGASTKNFQTDPAQFVLAGTPERVVARLAEYHAAGCGHFILAILDQGQAYLEQLSAVCAQVLPAVRSWGSG
ncbi:LLM class flavin-dependent oxidoreductase [Parafrankia irregularis]|nr:LLM class flavin-dependent oxidoreductase [Parafrankia irregularis]MBE3205648.1 LLM class flavin-dependent oxidoreductase [Parafrankia sp. CH37]